MSILASLLATFALCWLIWKGFERIIPAPVRAPAMWCVLAGWMLGVAGYLLRCPPRPPHDGWWLAPLGYLGVGAVVYAVRVFVLGAEGRAQRAKTRSQALLHVRHRAPPAPPAGGTPARSSTPTTRTTMTP